MANPNSALARAQAASIGAGYRARMASYRANLGASLVATKARMAALRDGHRIKLAVAMGGMFLGTVVGGQVHRRNPGGYGRQINYVTGIVGVIIALRAKRNVGIGVGATMVGLALAETGIWSSERDLMPKLGKGK